MQNSAQTSMSKINESRGRKYANEVQEKDAARIAVLQEHTLASITIYGRLHQAYF